jgi:hypothetical protein
MIIHIRASRGMQFYYSIDNRVATSKRHNQRYLLRNAFYMEFIDGETRRNSWVNNMHDTTNITHLPCTII